MAAWWRTERVCSVDDCTRKHRGRGFCQLHYRRWRRGGEREEAEPLAYQPLFIPDDAPLPDGDYCEACTVWMHPIFGCRHDGVLFHSACCPDHKIGQAS
jgi:hypothetical protein